jgi:adenine-specific DNA methylase
MVTRREVASASDRRCKISGRESVLDPSPGQCRLACGTRAHGMHANSTLQQEFQFSDSPDSQVFGSPSGIERAFSIPFVSELALKEKQIQQNVRPVIAVHKWFARRPGTLFRALLLAEFSGAPLEEAFFRANSLAGLRIADPFMGGGTPLLEANRLGCDVLGWDVNPMAYWVVRQEIEHLDLPLYERRALKIGANLETKLGALYKTTCQLCGARDVPAKYFVWVKVIACEKCAGEIRLLPGQVLAYSGRHPCNVLLCAACGELNEVTDLSKLGTCGSCAGRLSLTGSARRGVCKCSHCNHSQSYPRTSEGPPQHRMVAIEYHCKRCRSKRRGRLFKKPDDCDLQRVASAQEWLSRIRPKVIPADRIPVGDETARLHRWGYANYRDMFNARQLIGLEMLGREIAAVREPRIRNALATNLSDLVRYQNMACRYDSRALKSLDVFSVHGFPVGLLQCESNLLGIQPEGVRMNVGSGGWSNIVEKFIKAKLYCDEPFEIRYQGGRKKVVHTRGEWIGDHAKEPGRQFRSVSLHARSATEAELPEDSIDAVLTDPPYFANVQYAELMDFCYVWLRRLLVGESAFAPISTRNSAELTGNVTLNRGLEHFAEGLSEVFRRMARALKPGCPFVFTYHHNTLEAYYPVASAILDSRLTCTMSLPCPAEMGGSIHIHGTNSSIVDTVFVCRSTGRVHKHELVSGSRKIAVMVRHHVELLQRGGVPVSRGDTRCIAFGHLIRLAVWRLRGRWRLEAPTEEKLSLVRCVAESIGNWEEIERWLGEDDLGRKGDAGAVCESPAIYDGRESAEVSF